MDTTNGKHAKRESLWSKVEAVGEGVALGFRLSLAFLFVVLISGSAWHLGCKLSPTIGFIVAAAAAPFPFALGYFWVEAKLLIRIAAQVFLCF